MPFVPYGELADAPNVVVDGSATASTVLALSHWPRSGTPAELKADTSTEIVFRYLERPELHVETDVVSNNHFDEDGLAGIWAFLNPGEALRRRDLLVDVAAAGDFGTYRSREAARIVFTLAAYADEERSPLGAALFEQRYPDQAADLYRHLLARFHEILDHPGAYRALWAEEDARMTEAEQAIASGRITIEEVPEVDLAVVTIPAGVPCPEIALHNATTRFRVLEVRGRSYVLRYRYETWVQYVSSPPVPRADLSAFAKELSDEEPGAARWAFDGVDHITPAMRLVGADESVTAPDVFRRRVEAYLAAAPPAWDPFA